MTEQTAMERFRAALEKRGIEFETNDDECAEGEERTTLFKANLGEGEFDIFVAAKDWYFDGKLTPWLDVEFHNALTPEQAIAATLGSEREKALEELVRDWQVLAEARLDDEIALLKRIAELEQLVRDMLFAIRLGSMSDLTDRDVLKSWFRDFSERASDLGLMEVDE